MYITTRALCGLLLSHCASTSSLGSELRAVSQAPLLEEPSVSRPQVSVRLPPSLTPDFDLNSSWTGPPSGWLYGNWKIAWSSNPLYQPFWNPEFDNSPYFPQPKNGSQTNNDLATWNAQCENDTNVYSIFLHDTERIPDSFIFDTRATGPLSNQSNTWELMAWGYDTDGVGYIFLYEDAPTTGGLANICFEVREWGHPTSETKDALLAELRRFDISELTDLADDITALRHDDRRSGLPPYPCDEACQANKNTIAAWNRTANGFKRCPR